MNRLWVLLLLCTGASAQNCQIELNGFLLGQYKSALAGLGEPLEKGDHEGWKYEAYRLSPNGYWVFEFAPESPTQIAAIQISGEVEGMRPFRGVKLGDSTDVLTASLGRPDNRKPVADVRRELLTYNAWNYTVEVDQTGRVASIRIENEKECTRTLAEWLDDRVHSAVPLAPDGRPLLEELRAAVTKRDIDKLLQVLAPDVEFYRSGEVISFSRAARDELEKNDTALTRLLFAEQGSLLALLAVEKSAPDPQIRIYEKGPPGHVIKFPDSRIAKEIVYKFEAGRWKVFEVLFH